MSPYDQPIFDVVVIGELNTDLILSGDATPAFGQVEKLIDDATLTIGSSSAIFACGAARLGLRTAFIGKVGDDTFGRFMLESLNARGINTSGIIVDSHIKTGLSVMLSRGTDRAILTYPGSIAELHYNDIDWNIVQHARHLHLGSYFLLDKLRPHIPDLFKTARQRGLSISLDTNYDPNEKWNDNLQDTLQNVDVFLPNEVELHAIARTKDTASALRSLAHIPFVAVKTGARGGTAQHKQETVQAASIPVSVIDTTGAGDSFDAGFIYGYLNHWTAKQSLQLACICGSLSTRGIGGTAAQPTFPEAQAYLTSL
ncbi:MAG: carbohydrate kinase family protein [Anaerolineae bacterium]